MHSFKNDYGVLGNKEIIALLLKEANNTNIPYGLDNHSKKASSLIRKKFNLKKSSKIFYVAGGTQANLLVISYFLKNYEAVICCDTGHINVHETGAIEGSGHKVYSVLNNDGKIRAIDIIEACNKHIDCHQVKMKMVYISFPTESGTLYSKEELAAIYQACKDNNLLLYIDGARLGTGLTSPKNNIKIAEFASFCDIFTIGGTKNGMVMGEAIVFNEGKLAKEFSYHIKNKGAMLAKGYLVGLQYEAAFKNDLYFKNAKNANDMAIYLGNKLLELGIELPYGIITNQLFLKVNEKLANYLINNYELELWEKIDNYVIIRAVTSFVTTIKDCDALILAIKNELKEN